MIAKLAVTAALLTSWATQERALQEVAIEPTYADGRLAGCGVRFLVVDRDEVYASGNVVGVSGSFHLYGSRDTSMVALLKIGLSDAGGPFVAPSTAYLLNEFSTNADDALAPLASETPGYRLIIFNLGDATTDAIVSVGETGHLHFAYQREGGRSAVPVDVDLASTEGAHGRWIDCIDALVGQDEQAD